MADHKSPKKGRMLGFVSVEPKMPEKRPAELRREDFLEIYGRYATARAEEQSNRCSQCGVPFCQVHCPLHNNIPDWLKMTAEGRLEEAYEISSATNNFPEICGRICPQDRLCEGNCTTEQSGHGAITIGSVEKYITDTAWENGWVKPVKPAFERAESVGIIGAGPGGLAAAMQLRAQGYKVIVYDRYDRVGGLLIYGIPGFKLEKDIVLRRHQQMVESGIEFRLGVDVGKDISFAELRGRHDSVLIAIGVYRARGLKAPGSGLKGIYPALDYLTTSNRVSLGDKVEAFANGSLDAKGKKVVVIGGGDTAMDCVRTAVRQGAVEVTCLYRRNRANMPGSQREVANAEEEGVVFTWQAAPEGFTGSDKVDGVLAHRIHLGVPDASGRQSPQVIEGSQFRIEADMVIEALGFEPEDISAMFGEPSLEVTRWGTLKADHRSKMTTMDGVFAAGDIVRGASLVVWAVRDGRDAATAMHRYMEGRRVSAVAAE
ncbi:NAD(P)-dependent oxidoreductase [Radicibacter daui]|uniref:NAD(P)-dependent oxidoreductase n=1 Tax=Radicibacter daui TaxID=3064829 RepID=UPI004046F6B6